MASTSSKINILTYVLNNHGCIDYEMPHLDTLNVCLNRDNKDEPCTFLTLGSCLNCGIFLDTHKTEEHDTAGHTIVNQDDNAEEIDRHLSYSLLVELATEHQRPELLPDLHQLVELLSNAEKLTPECERDHLDDHECPEATNTECTLPHLSDHTCPSTSPADPEPCTRDHLDEHECETARQLFPICPDPERHNGCHDFDCIHTGMPVTAPKYECPDPKVHRTCHSEDCQHAVPSPTSSQADTAPAAEPTSLTAAQSQRLKQHDELATATHLFLKENELKPNFGQFLDHLLGHLEYSPPPTTLNAKKRCTRDDLQYVIDHFTHSRPLVGFAELPATERRPSDTSSEEEDESDSAPDTQVSTTATAQPPKRFACTPKCVSNLPSISVDHHPNQCEKCHAVSERRASYSTKHRASSWRKDYDRQSRHLDVEFFLK